MPVSSDIASVPTPSVGTEVVIRVDGVQGVKVLMFRFVFMGKSIFLWVTLKSSGNMHLIVIALCTLQCVLNAFRHEVTHKTLTKT